MTEENKALIRRYFEAIDANEAGDWDVLDEFLAPNFVSHGGLPPGIRGDRDGVKKAAEMFRRAAPGKHEIVDQLAEGVELSAASGGLAGTWARSSACRLPGTISTSRVS